ncbi:TPA: hypothetical protein N0F65_012367 [Lagenidium giganteum]|uniref:HAT C-terminal dimerisation domain-containing protein n=1 Tax=Lagenidium giganteum TaxID=4803 RepID=A0AAV2YSH8_9STRA|nr:TPA: hypothetical protein N0F65_012367 [Lagenidium giganteum]
MCGKQCFRCLVNALLHLTSTITNPAPQKCDGFDLELYDDETSLRHSSRSIGADNSLAVQRSREVITYFGVALGSNKNTSTLEWWRQHHHQLPLLSALARKWLRFVAKSVPSERAFSTSGNVVLRNDAH